MLLYGYKTSFENIGGMKVNNMKKILLCSENATYLRSAAEASFGKGIEFMQCRPDGRVVLDIIESEDISAVVLPAFMQELDTLGVLMAIE